MQRRTFAGGLGACVITSGLVAPAIADVGGIGGDNAGPDSARVRLYLDGRWVAIRMLVATNALIFLAILLNRAMPYFNEQRADLSGVPGVGTFQRRPFGARFEEASPLGRVQLHGDTLFATLRDARLLGGNRVTIGHRGHSWDLTPGFQPVEPLQGLSFDRSGALGNAPVVGEIRREDPDRVLIDIFRSQRSF